MKQRLILLGLLVVLAAGEALSLVSYLYNIVINPRRAWLIAIAIDGVGNVMTGGKLGMTISARSARAQAAGKRWGCLMCEFLDDVDEGHCERALTDPKQNMHG